MRSGFKVFKLVLVLVPAIFTTTLVFPQSNETLTISTYYPAPSGVYQNLRLFPTTTIPACNEGTLYYNETTHQLALCSQGNIWMALTNFWTQSGANLYPNQTAWNVGIGTTSPGTKLEIDGIASQSTDGITMRAADDNWVRSGPSRGAGTYTPLSQAGDASIIYSAANTIDTGALVIGQWSNSARGIRIDSSGNLGIGTASPQRTLHVAGSNGMRLAASAKPAGNNAGDIVIDSNNSNTLTYNNGSGWVTMGGGGGCYISYTGSCLAGFTNKGSPGNWGYCWNSSENFCHWNPPGGTCASPHTTSPNNSDNYGTSALCCL